MAAGAVGSYYRLSLRDWHGQPRSAGEFYSLGPCCSILRGYIQLDLFTWQIPRANWLTTPPTLMRLRFEHLLVIRLTDVRCQAMILYWVQLDFFLHLAELDFVRRFVTVLFHVQFQKLCLEIETLEKLKWILDAFEKLQKLRWKLFINWSTVCSLSHHVVYIKQVYWMIFWKWSIEGSCQDAEFINA